MRHRHKPSAPKPCPLPAPACRAITPNPARCPALQPARPRAHALDAKSLIYAPTNVRILRLFAPRPRCPANYWTTGALVDHLPPPSRARRRSPRPQRQFFLAVDPFVPTHETALAPPPGRADVAAIAVLPAPGSVFAVAGS
jgi:hypothetical protein